jgi:hypothetical protein
VALLRKPRELTLAEAEKIARLKDQALSMIYINAVFSVCPNLGRERKKETALLSQQLFRRSPA